MFTIQVQNKRQHKLVTVIKSLENVRFFKHLKSYLIIKMLKIIYRVCISQTFSS